MPDIRLPLPVSLGSPFLCPFAGNRPTPSFNVFHLGSFVCDCLVSDTPIYSFIAVRVRVLFIRPLFLLCSIHASLHIFFFCMLSPLLPRAPLHTDTLQFSSSTPILASRWQSGFVTFWMFTPSGLERVSELPDYFAE